jgi:hypothetical protein
MKVSGVPIGYGLALSMVRPVRVKRVPEPAVTVNGLTSSPPVALHAPPAERPWTAMRYGTPATVGVQV